MIKNAKVTRTFLDVEDHGILTCNLDLDYGDSSGQGFGGWSLDEPKRDENDKILGRFGTAEGMEYIRRLLSVLGVEQWEKLPGTFVRVETDGDGWGGKILRIGHPLKDRWFDPKAMFEEFRLEKSGE